MNSREALERLKKGNIDYIKNDKNITSLTQEKRVDTAINGQHPYAVIVTCSDSRVPAEHIFSAGIGELFVIRTAGNIISSMELGSVEYGVEHLGAPLVVVMGHTHCGAVEATLAGGKPEGAVAKIVEEITEAIKGNNEPRLCEVLNARNGVNKLKSSEILHEIESEGKLEIISAIYDIESGVVNFDI